MRNMTEWFVSFSPDGANLTLLFKTEEVTVKRLKAMHGAYIKNIRTIKKQEKNDIHPEENIKTVIKSYKGLSTIVKA